MTKRNLAMLFMIILIVTLGTIGFFIMFEKKSRIVWQGLQGKAKNDRYYVAERFLRSKGLQVKREKTYAYLDKHTDLSGYDTLFFSNEAKRLTANQIIKLLNWVEQGGKLVVSTKNVNYDRKRPPDSEKSILVAVSKQGLLQSAGIAVAIDKKYDRCEKIQKKTDADGDEYEVPEADKVDSSRLTKSQRLDKLLRVDLSDQNYNYSPIKVGGQTLQLRWSHYKKDLFAHKGMAKLLWAQPAYCRGDLFADFLYGDGHIVVYQNSAFDFKSQAYENYAGILNDHNATYLYLLLNLGKSANKLLWFERDSYPTAWGVLWKYGHYALITLGLLLLAWLWKNGRRFGPFIRIDERENLLLERHLQATGNFYAQKNQQKILIDNCYEKLEQSINKAMPLASRLTQSELVEQLAEKTKLPLQSVESVLNKRYPKDDAEFTQLMYTINTIREKL